MSFWAAMAISIALLFVTIIVFAMKIVYPYHRALALIVYVIGWVFFIYSLSLRKQWILEHKETVTSFFSMFYIHIIFGIIMLVSIYLLFVLFPAAKSPFIGLDDNLVSQIINEDEKIILYLDEKLSANLDLAIEKNVLEIDFKDIKSEEKEDLREFWTLYIEALLELDLLKEKYKTFYQLNPVTKGDLHQKAFANGYTAFLAQHYYMLQLTEKLTAPALSTSEQENQNIVTFLNEGLVKNGIESGIYDILKEKLTNEDELIRLNSGRAYRTSIIKEVTELDVLVDKYLSKIDNSVTLYSNLIADKPLNLFEKKSFELWFPVQKEFATNISYIKATNREYHIKAEVINQHREKLLPGDIILERREWHATNIGIPGYWTHSALYIGTIEYLNNYFKDLPELEDSSFEDFLKKDFPDVYDKFKTQDEDEYKYAVIESKRPGVILLSLEESTNADSIAVLRVKKANRSDHFKIVTQALKYFGKPYDFNFDFITDNALVCSELVYKAFAGIDGFTITPSEFNGRLIVSPNQFAQKFAKEYDTEESDFELILFLDGNEKTGVVHEKEVDEFNTTWERPKWHIAKDFVNTK
jgi:Permuted papain-like amidase enzyme, YaeF/YiiX, C92 family